MTYVIAEPRIDVLDRSCVEECPVDCIYEGDRALYIHPDECVDCGVCEPVWPGRGDLLRGRRARSVVGIHRGQRPFSAEPLPGAAAPLGSPGGAANLGRIGADTELVAGHPLQGQPGAAASDTDRPDRAADPGEPTTRWEQR